MKETIEQDEESRHEILQMQFIRLEAIPNQLDNHRTANYHVKLDNPFEMLHIEQMYKDFTIKHAKIQASHGTFSVR